MGKEDKKNTEDRKQTVVLQKAKVCKGSIKYETENEGGKAVDNLYVYKDSPVLKGLNEDSYPDEITITVRAGGKSEKAEKAEKSES